MDNARKKTAMRGMPWDSSKFKNIIHAKTEPQNVYIVRVFDPINIIRMGEDGQGEYVRVDQWSLLPSWSKTRQFKGKDGRQLATFNARLDRVRDSNTWRGPFKKQRCLIPANGYYEWVEEPGAKKSRPYLVQRQDEDYFFFAGLWDRWIDKATGEVVESATLVTTTPNALMDKIGHDRCPCILAADAFDVWLDPQVQDADALVAMLETPYDPGNWQATPLSHRVNYRHENGPDIVEPFGPTVTC